jgi:hypothetical protein
VDVSQLELRLPVREVPNCGVVKTPASPVLPAGQVLAPGAAAAATPAPRRSAAHRRKGRRSHRHRLMQRRGHRHRSPGTRPGTPASC